MTVSSVKHPFVSAKADGPDATLVRPIDWNNKHTLFEVVMPRVMGLNAVSTATTIVLTSALAIVARDANGNTYCKFNQGSLTCNSATAGPAIQGRDQAGAFGASVWIYIYYIYNPTTDTWASTMSTAVPTTGPAMPSGYTAWALATEIYFNGSSNFAVVYARGSWVYHTPALSMLAAGASTNEAAISLTTLVPSNALAFQAVRQNAITADAAGVILAQVRLRVLTTVEYENHTMNVSIANNGSWQLLGEAITFPYTGNFYYLLTTTTGSAHTLTIGLQAYKIPNGDS